MDPERWSRIEEIFHAALEKEPSERHAFLDHACAGDPETRTEVMALLGAHAEGGDRLEQVVESTAALVTAEGDVPDALRIGPYRVIRELGRGGMATVYLAEPDDAQYRMRVAIKLIRHGMDTRDVLRRLRQERQILASLDHPHIARLLDGGSTADGQPYFVMEHIEGEPVDSYCERR